VVIFSFPRCQIGERHVKIVVLLLFTRSLLGWWL
jgi:hypothetical protein